MATLDGQTWEQFKNTEGSNWQDFLYVYGGGTDEAAAKAGWEHEHNTSLANSGYKSPAQVQAEKQKAEERAKDPAAVTAAIQAANDAARNKYNQDRLNKVEIPGLKIQQEDQRLKEATQEWLQTYQTSLMTGKYKGQDTVAWAATQAGITGYYKDQPTLEREKFEADNVFRTASLIASLRGPRNAFQMSKVLTEGGLNGVLAGASGKYGLPSFGGTNVAPEPVTLQNFLGDASRGISGIEDFKDPYRPQQQTPLILDNPQNNQQAMYVSPVNYSPPGAQAPTNQYNYQGTPDGSSYVYPPGSAAPPQSAQVSTATPQDPAMLNQATGGGLYGYPSYAANPVSSTPVPGPDYTAPSQINAKNYNNLNPYNKDMLWAYYESLGYDPAAAQAEFEASLPSYGGPRFGQVKGVIS